MTVLKYLTTLVASLTPLMYFHGSVFHDGYLRALSIPPDLFPLSFEQALVQGFMSYMLLSIPALLLLLAYLLLALGVAYNLHEVSKINFVKKIIGKLSNNFKVRSSHKVQGSALIQTTLKWISYSVIAVLCILIFLGGTIGIAIKVELLGKENAHKNISDISKNSILQELLLTRGDLIRGYVLKCSNYGCAIYSNKAISVIPLTAIDRINIPTIAKP